MGLVAELHLKPRGFLCVSRCIEEREMEHKGEGEGRVWEERREDVHGR
jgi:hypothetical protein